MTESGKHKQFMDVAIECAREGEGSVCTNPLVGACLVSGDEIIARGSHRWYGDDHAEIDVLSSAESIPEDAVLYTTLEPCIFPGKTGDCVSEIIRSPVQQVVVADEDPDSGVSGRGIEALRAAGIEVIVGIGTNDYRRVNRAYHYQRTTGNPWIDLKLAMSGDGKIAVNNGNSQWITGEKSREHGHKLRSLADGVMIGANTLRNDNPRLTDRVTGSDHQPKALVITRFANNLPRESHLLTERANSTILVTRPGMNTAWRRELESRGVEILVTDTAHGWVIWRQVFPRLTQKGIGRILVEGGGVLAGNLIESNYVCETHFYYSGRLIGNGIPGIHMNQVYDRVEETPRAHLVDSRAFEEDVYVRRFTDSAVREAGLSSPFRQ
ncbi:MAG: bifunctional diaminohydroxyphosphoribosylaminopyrimidine deaminase/5-amino-6-(5-phosphoribosylamino)uracil reductase RibD [bacterium]